MSQIRIIDHFFIRILWDTTFRLGEGSPRHPAQARHELLYPSRFFLFSEVRKVEMLFTTLWHLTSFTIVFQRAAHLLR